MIPTKLNRTVIYSFIYIVKFIWTQANLVVHLYIAPLCIPSLLIKFFSRTLVILIVIPFPLCYRVLKYDMQNLEIPTINILGKLVESGVRVLVYRLVCYFLTLQSHHWLLCHILLSKQRCFSLQWRSRFSITVACYTVFGKWISQRHRFEHNRVL